ncbi:MAG: PDDEXK nuclease domain-containing protein, partial [Saprospiraceae bacterium]
MNLSQQIIILYQKQQKGTCQKVPFCRVECFWQIGQLLFSSYWEIIHEPTAWKAALKQLSNSNTAMPASSKLAQMGRFYLSFPTHQQLSAILSGSHYLVLTQLTFLDSRKYYHQEAINERWTLGQLKKAIANHQFERSKPLLTTNKSAIVAHSKTYFQFSFLEKFHGQTIPESVLEDALIEQLQDFLGELGKGFAFVARQKRLITPNGKQMFVDLLFYNYLLQRFVLIDLKVVPLSYEHIGQMDTYCRLFDETNPLPETIPCLGIILCPK